MDYFICSIQASADSCGVPKGPKLPLLGGTTALVLPDHGLPAPYNFYSFFLYRNWMTKWQISHFCRNNPENTSPYIFHIHIQIQFLSHKIIWCHKKTILLELCRAATTKPWQIEHSVFFRPDHNGQTWIYRLVSGSSDFRLLRKRDFPTEDDVCASPRINLG